MTLEQTTMFGVRGERVRIKKASPIARLAAGDRVDFHLRIGGPVTSTGHEIVEIWRRPNNFGADVARITGKAGWVALEALTRTPADGRSGEASGCGLLVLLAAALACFALAYVIERRGARVRVAWIREYPDPVCERCGKVLDGSGAGCVEEGNRE